MKKMQPVVHFEFPYKNNKRISAFYKKAFNWQIQELGAGMGMYILATTTAVDEKGRPCNGINGGFYPRKANMPAQYPSVVIAVDDIKKAMVSVKKAGGKVLGKPMAIPGYGWYVSFYDTEGNRNSLMEPDMKAK